MTSSNQVISRKTTAQFQRAVSTMRPKPGLTALRCSLSSGISLGITNLIQFSGFNRRRLAKQQGKSIILNIGCADHLDPAYINADIFPPVGRALRLLGGKGKIAWSLFLNIIKEDKSLIGSADGIVFAHVLEHIPADRAVDALTNCFRYLKPGGDLRLSVPHIRAYPFVEGSDSSNKISDAISRNLLIYGHFHQFMYEPELIISLLEEIGFVSVKEVSFGQGTLGDSDRPEREHESFYVVASKPV
jgi:SAM-dependent methyltransferase